MKREIEDGMGFNGLIPTKQERYIEKIEAENKKLRKILDEECTCEEATHKGQHVKLKCRVCIKREAVS